MRHPSYREVHLAEARREARRAFSSHEVVSLSPRSASFASPAHGDNAFDVVALGWRSVVVHGDFEAVVFQGGDGDDIFERVDWLASMGAYDAANRAQRATGRSYDEFHPRAFAECVLRAAEERAGEERRGMKALAVEVAREDLTEHDAIVRALELGVEFGEGDVSVYERTMPIRLSPKIRARWVGKLDTNPAGRFLETTGRAS